MKPRLGSFGLSTTPIMDIKSELQEEIERSQRVILYNPPVTPRTK